VTCKNVRRSSVFALGALAALFGFQGARIASAQSLVVASIAGVVQDPSGTGVSAAEVTVKNLTSDKTQTTKSDVSGGYSVENLDPGSYEITVKKYGFSDLKARVVLESRRQLRTDLQLKLAAVDESASAPDAAKLAALEARVQQLEAELTTAKPEEIPQSVSPATAPMVATASKDASQLPQVAEAQPKPSTGSRIKELLLAAALPAAAAPAPAPAPAPSPAPQAAAPAPPPAPTVPEALQAPEPGPPGVDTQTPFAYGDFTWLNGTPRNKDTVIDTKFFTPEIRFDTHYMEDFNQPIDHTIVGATESFRSGEVQIEQASVGGDFHWQNVRGRILFMDGLFATTTPRNDASSATGQYPGNTGGVGQWDLQNAYKYVSEAFGGYHFNVQHGLNVDAGIFVSYIGLFSYYNFDNWTYQPSYVSSNTPWFFNGVRVQWFPTNKLKIEPWFINGWQSYAKYNGHPGLGGQLLWEPTEWFKLVANQYGYGQDNLGLPHTERLHTDDSIEIRFYNNPNSTGLSKIAMSLTADAGSQYGGGLCGTCAPSQGKDSFVGWMAYNRYWFKKDLWALTLGGGEMSNWGRYLTLLPPIDGAWASTGSVYFPELPGQRAHMWDSTVTLQYMPKQYITWWFEAGYRHSDIPYFAGRGGVTPPGGNNGLPQYYTCLSGASSGTGTLSAAQAACGGPGSVWFPDLRRSEPKISAGVMVKF